MKLKKILTKLEKEVDKKLDLNKSFKENNLDSLDLMSIISEVENEFNITLKEKDLKKIKNFITLEKYI